MIKSRAYINNIERDMDGCGVARGEVFANKLYIFLGFE